MKKLFNLLLCLLVMLAVTGCGQVSAKPAVEEYLSNSKAEISDNYAEEMGLDELFEGSEEVSAKVCEMLKDFDYVIGEETIEDDKATVAVTISAYDFSQIFTDYFNDYMNQIDEFINDEENMEGLDEDQFMDIMTELSFKVLSENLDIVKEAGKTYTTDLEFNLNKTDDGWEVDEDSIEEDLGYAILGGFYNSLSELFSY